MINGKELIEKMREEFGLTFWSTPDLIRYILKQDKNRHITLLDPQVEEHCFELNGSFTIAEIDAMYIAQVNDRGSMRG